MPTKTTKKKSAKKVAKKTTKKVATKSVKKPAKKKTTKKKDEGRVLVCANDEQCFWTTDGQVLATLLDLRDSLEGMVDDVYKYHAAKGKNDFADWVEFVLEDDELAGALRRSRKASSARSVVLRYLKFYKI